jgi:hypothetical protein
MTEFILPKENMDQHCLLTRKGQAAQRIRIVEINSAGKAGGFDNLLKLPCRVLAE